MDRRQFLAGSVVGTLAGLATGGAKALAAEPWPPVEKPKGPAVLKLCSQESRIPGKTLKEKVENILKFGGCGIEFHGNAAARIQEIKDTLAGSGVGVAAICAGYFPLIDPNPEERQKGIENLKKILTAAGELGSPGVIFVPAFNKHPQLEGKEARKVLLECLAPVGEHAVACKTRVLMEPLNRLEAFFLRQLADAASICRDSKSPGVALMGDFYHMYIEETSDEGAFLSAGPWLHHVHLASRIRVLPGQDERSFVDGFRGLKRIGYQDYCSLECGIKKDTDPMVEIPKSFEFLKRQWDEAVV